MKTRRAKEKETQLRVWMRRKRSVLVAFSGGVDSSYLALIATEVLGSDALIVTGVSASVSDHQLRIAKTIAADHGFNHHLIRTHETNNPQYIKNGGDRCYFCKDELYAKLNALAKRQPGPMVIVDGTNGDDLNDFRPGRKAAIENGVVSPLAELGFSKAEIRSLSRDLHLETWDQPASPCLASRVMRGVPVRIERLDLVEKGEELLRDSGFREFRLRVDRRDAKIEIASDEMNKKSFESRLQVVSARIKSLGFDRVRLDPNGYKSGSSNAVHGLKRTDLIDLV